MPTRSDESPPRQQDRPPEPERVAPDESRKFERFAAARPGDPDTAVAWTEDPDINTNGSER